MTGYAKNVTAIVLSFSRVKNVKRIAAHLNQVIGLNVIVVNNNPEFNYGCYESRNINHSVDFGLYTRFSTAVLVDTPYIWYNDDDILVPKDSFESLYDSFLENTNRVCGTHGRNCPNDIYNTVDAWGDVDVTLTRGTFVSRENCLHAAMYLNQIKAKGEPVGNGEDIILSCVASHRSKVKNKAVQVKVEDMPEAFGSISIHKRFPRHVSHRTQVLQEIKKLLEEQV